MAAQNLSSRKTELISLSAVRQNLRDRYTGEDCGETNSAGLAKPSEQSQRTFAVAVLATESNIPR